MRILVFSWRDPKHPLAGGAEQSMHEHMKGWVKAGHEVTLFSSGISRLPKEEVLDGIKMIRSGNQYLGVQIKGFFFYLKNKERFDFIVDQFHGLPFFTPLYSKKPKLAVLQEVAKEVWFRNYFPFPLNVIVGILGYLFEPLVFIFYKNTQFMVGSNSAKLDLIRYGIRDEKIDIVPHGVISPKKKISKDKDLKYKTITFLGNLSEDKGILDALYVFNRLKISPEYNFWVIGRPENEAFMNKINNRVKSLGLIKRVKFWGRVDNEQKFKLLSKSYLLVNTSIREGWGLVNIEANLVSTPVVAYPSQGLVDSVKNGVSGVIAKKCTPESIAKTIVEIDDKKYKHLSFGAKKWASNFNWNKSRAISLKLIENLYHLR